MKDRVTTKRLSDDHILFVKTVETSNGVICKVHVEDMKNGSKYFEGSPGPFTTHEEAVEDCWAVARLNEFAAKLIPQTVLTLPVKDHPSGH